MRPFRVDVSAVGLDQHFLGLIAKARELAMKEVSDSSFVAGDGLDVYELAREGDDVHEGEHNPSAGRCNLFAVSNIKSFFIDGPAGRVEALLNGGAENATRAALVCHPHPLFGGTLHNKVVFHAMKALNSFGFPVLRFNFRGTGLSHGEHDNARGEVEDVRAALEWLDREFHLPMVFAGFSFGAAVGLRAACPDESVKEVIGLGLPVAAIDGRAYNFDFLQTCGKPKLLVSGGRDQFGPRAQLERVVESLPEPRKLVVIEGADHFFEGRLQELREAIEAWIGDAVLVSR